MSSPFSISTRPAAVSRFTRNAQQQVLGADVVRIEALRFGRGRFQYAGANRWELSAIAPRFTQRGRCAAAILPIQVAVRQALFQAHLFQQSAESRVGTQSGKKKTTP